MAWLVTHMWMVLAGATVFALMLGWSVRGILLTGRMRNAIVDKDVALTELDQARDEIERLFAAQRAQRGEGGSVADASERKISDLTAELQKAKTELATLKTETAKTGTADPSKPKAEGEMPTIVLPPNRGGADETPGASEDAGAATPAQGGEEPTLVWRNRHLEARVQHLESQLAGMAATPADAEPAPSGEAEPAAATVAARPSADEEGLAKLKWQADYLKQRVEALEGELAKAPAETPVVTEEDLNEEMARLRWRNRFLEGRLAYFEGGAEEAAAETVAETAGAQAMLEELEVTDTAADMTEAVEAMAEGLTVAERPDEAEPDFVEAEDEAPEEAAFETPAETEPVDVEVVEEEDAALVEEDVPASFVEDTAETLEAGPEEDDGFEDVSNDEEESLAEADHADEDVLSDEEYDEEDFVDEDADEPDEFDDDAADDGAEDDDDEESDEQDGTYDEEESWDEDDESEGDFEDDEDTGSDEDEAYDDDEDESEAEDEDDEVPEEAWDDDADDADEDEASAGADEGEAGDESSEAGVAYEADDTIVRERPMSMNGPVEGHPDDLTLIGGIGPKIQILLNELGVWHYDQIAEWTPENVAWVDEHLNFNGRIIREGWVEQAAVLVRDAENA